MNNEKGYQGWTNYETWSTALWMDNDQSTYEYYREETRRIISEAKVTEVLSTKEIAIGELSELLKDETEATGEAAITENGPMRDLLTSAIANIDFYEIAKNLIDEVEEQKK